MMNSRSSSVYPELRAPTEEAVPIEGVQPGNVGDDNEVSVGGEDRKLHLAESVSSVEVGQVVGISEIEKNAGGSANNTRV